MLNAITWIVFCFWCSSVEVLGELEIVGEISFDLKIKGSRKELGHLTIGDNDNLTMSKELGHLTRTRGDNDNVTAAPLFECQYQYPEAKQIDAMLSHMMNQLTKVFVRVNEYVAVKPSRRALSRFKKVASKRTDFFDDIFANMSREYKAFANKTWAQVPRAWTSRDPCLHQNEIKGVWRDLLYTSEHSLRSAAQECVEKYLKVVGCESAHVRSHVNEILRSELAQIKPELLVLLCDTFQLCYNDFN